MNTHSETGSSQKLSRTGSGLLRGLARLIQIAKLYEDNNNLIIQAVKAFKTAVKEGSNRSRYTSLQIISGRFFLQDERLPLFRKDAQINNQMLLFLTTRSIYGIHIDADLGHVAIEEILIFIRLLNRAKKQKSPSEWLKTELDKNNIHWVVILDQAKTLRDISLDSELKTSESLEQKKKVAKKTYHYALSSVKEVAEKLLSKKETGVRKSVRMVQRMIDIITDDDTTFMALSTIRIYDDYTFMHSLNVALLAMSIGKRIGMSRDKLEKLGLCGLFHDLGKVEIPKQILNKRGRLNDSEFEEIKKHSTNSAMLILRLNTQQYSKAHLFVSPFEHHIRYDLSGYPSIGNQPPISLFGRILTIVDVYDALTSPRIYRPTSMSPDKALGVMLADSGKFFDPVLLKVFVNMLGLYPVGTLLKLDTGEMGLTLHCSDPANRARPKVQLLLPNGDNNFTKGHIVDLTEYDPEKGDFKRNIIETQHPSSLGIQPAKFIV